MKLRDLGEDGFLEKLQETFPNLIADITDDCAIITPDETTLVSSDMLIEGTHFTIPPFDHYHVGTKAALANISDILATGGRPLYLSICVGVPPETDLEDLLRLYRGIEYACERYGCTIIGGDTCRSDKLILSVTVLGTCKDPVKRSGAKPDQVLIITGRPGTSAVGLEALLKGYPLPLFFQQIERHLIPGLRSEFALAVAEKRLAKAMIDISDGLIKDAHRLSKASGVAVEIEKEKLPGLLLSEEQLKWLEHSEEFYILNGGEEYELMLTAQREDIPEIEKIARKTNTPISIIGGIREGSGVYLISKGKRIPASHRGFSHFQEEENA